MVEQDNVFRGHYGLFKAIVTRVDTPSSLYSEEDSKRRLIQVCIIGLHKGIEINSSNEIVISKEMAGSGDDPGKYPWAQVSSNLYNGLGSSSKITIK